MFFLFPKFKLNAKGIFFFENKNSICNLSKKKLQKKSAFFTNANFSVTFEILKCLFTKVNFNSEISKKP